MCVYFVKKNIIKTKKTLGIKWIFQNFSKCWRANFEFQLIRDFHIEKMMRIECFKVHFKNLKVFLQNCRFVWYARALKFAQIYKLLRRINEYFNRSKTTKYSLLLQLLFFKVGVFLIVFKFIHSCFALQWKLRRKYRMPYRLQVIYEIF